MTTAKRSGRSAFFLSVRPSGDAGWYGSMRTRSPNTHRFFSGSVAGWPKLISLESLIEAM